MKVLKPSPLQLSPLSYSRAAVRCLCGATTNTVPRIVTHNGIFHCDEVLGTWILLQTKKFRDAEVIRTRDVSIMRSADVVLDVGGVYDPDALRFDHHHQDFEEYFSGGRRIKLSSAGLIYRHFGKEVLRLVLEPVELSDEDLHLLYTRLYKHFVQAVDAVDNGISTCRDSVVNFIDKSNIISRVGMCNPTWQDRLSREVSKSEEDECFMKAVHLCGHDFTAYAKHLAKNWLPASSYVKHAIENRCSISSTGKIIFLPLGCPWKDHLHRLEKELQIQGTICFCLHQDVTGVHIAQAVPQGHSTFRVRHRFPASWRGLEGEDLDDVVGLTGCVFAHHYGYIAGHTTRQGALEMAEKALLFA